MKFAGKCAVCKKEIPVGAPVLWAKGEGVKHEGCATAPPPRQILCAICDNGAGCATCELRDDCDLERISPLCICPKCAQADALVAYTSAVNAKFTILDTSKKIGQNTLV